MPRSVASLLIKGIEYFSLPFQYPRDSLTLFAKIITNHTLVHELPRLAPQRVWFQKTGIRTVIDVGAFIGSFAYAMRTMLPGAQIYSFEPLDENYRQLVKNLSARGCFRAFQTALGDHRGTLDFYRNDFSASSSALEMADLHRQAFPRTAHQTRITVPLACLDDFLDEMVLQPPVLLKLDVQGYEATVLKGAGKTLEKVNFLLSEVSFRELYTGQPLFDELHSLLARLGFAYAGSLDTMLSPLDGSILQADALFTRKA